jgi:hypothetical protein
MKNWEPVLRGFRRAAPFLGVMALFFQCTGCWLDRQGWCGDNECQTEHEDMTTCAQDCSYCGDGVCYWIYGEDSASCPQDCAESVPSPEPGVEEPAEIEAIPNVCGDGICNTMYENSDLCPDDCECVDDGECEPGEGLGCRDCTDDVSRHCGQPCESSDECGGVLSCFEGMCWQECACTGRCGPDDDDDGGGTDCRPCGAPCEEYCSSPDTFCEDGCCRCP